MKLRDSPSPWLAVPMSLAMSLHSAVAGSPPPATVSDSAERALPPELTAPRDAPYTEQWNWESIRAPANADSGEEVARFDAWKILSTRMDFALNYHQPAVDVSLRRYLQNPSSLKDAIPQAALYLPYVTGRMLENNLPPELALLPFVESAYNPKALSPNGASGLWQIMPATADRLGLKRNQWYDGRNDLIGSTDAVIAYLSYLNRRFNGDWLLSLAAYNSGEGVVARAVSASEANGEKADFWTLNLPDHTRHFVPKFLALARIFRSSDQIQNLERPQGPQPGTIRALLLPRQISLAQAARLADIDYQLIQRLNTGLKRGVTPPEGPHRVVVPGSAAERLLAAIEASE